MDLFLLLLMVAAVVCLFLAAFGVGVRRVAIGWLGLALWALAVLIPAWPDM
jgi:hypothetical protein